MMINLYNIKRSIELFGTPIYLYFSEEFNKNWQLLKSIIPDDTTIYYSVKANPNISIIKVFKELGAYFEVASIGELQAVIANNVESDRIIFVGPGKSDEELSLYTKATFVIESVNELNRINSIAKEVVKIYVRLNTQKSYGTLSMGGNTQFGMQLKDIDYILRHKTKWKNINIIGIHGYLGTGILDFNEIVNNFSAIIQSIKQLETDSNFMFQNIDLGGGFGIPYFEKQEIKNIDDLKQKLSNLYSSLNNSNNRKFAVESGRFLVGTSGVYITQVIDVKINNDTTYVIIDGGINNLNYDNSYGFRHPPFEIITKNIEKHKFSICGHLCTPADRFVHNCYTILPSVGDYIIFKNAGAYGLSAATNMFLSHSIPPEILYKKGEFHIIREKTDSSFFLNNQKLI